MCLHISNSCNSNVLVAQLAQWFFSYNSNILFAIIILASVWFYFNSRRGWDIQLINYRCQMYERGHKSHACAIYPQKTNFFSNHPVRICIPHTYCRRWRRMVFAGQQTTCWSKVENFRDRWFYEWYMNKHICQKHLPVSTFSDRDKDKRSK